MRNLIRPIFLLTAAFILFSSQAKAWGFWAHQRINRLAVFTLPPEMFGLYKANIDYLTEHSTDPDSRRYAVDGEAPRHFIDIDHYCEIPFECMPRKWVDAVEKFSEDTLQEYGIVPWHINVMFYRLVEAFKSKDLAYILKVSSDIGHYIADSNVPLHTTENYNGQLTDQKGIHGLWESRIPEIFGENYNYYVGQAIYLKHPLTEAWNCVLESHTALDSVLSFERKLTEKFPSDRKFTFENRNNVLIKTYSREFCTAYHNMLDGMVERRLRSSIIRIGSFWYSAWVEAGQPDLKSLEGTKVEEKQEQYEKNIKIKDRESDAVGYLDSFGIFPMPGIKSEIHPPLQLVLEIGGSHSCCAHSASCRKVTEFGEFTHN